MKTIRDREEQRLGWGVALAFGGAVAGTWIVHQLFPAGTQNGSMQLGSLWLGAFTGWLGWRLGILLPDLASPELRSERALRIRTQTVRIARAMTRGSALATCLGALLGVAAVGPLIETHPGWIHPGGVSGHRALGAGIAAGLLRGTAAVAGGWLGYHANRIISGAGRRDEERRPNR